jgi:hypothetical protein
MDFRTSRRKLILFALALVILLLAGVAALHHAHSRRIRMLAMLFDPTTKCGVTATNGIQRTYATSFPLTENPISEQGNWIVSGGDFASVRTISGLAFGTQTGTRTAPGKYDDSTALLTGSWGTDQFVQIVVHYDGAPTDSDYDEVEIRLRSAISEKSNTGYEINCRVGRPGMEGYIQVGKINGPIGDFSGSFDERYGIDYACHDGDVLTATIVGTTLTAYINARQVLQANDSTYSAGAPGIGFYHEKTQAQNSDFGISRVIASDRVPWLGVSTPPCE